MTDRLSGFQMAPQDEAKRVSINELIEHFGMGKFQTLYVFSMSIVEGADGMEVLTMSLLGVVLQCTWYISLTDVAFMTMFVFIGMAIGAPVFGNLADRYGRKSILLLNCSVALFFALLSGLAPTFAWFCFLRCILGCGLGGSISTTSTFLSEISPIHFRAKIQSIMFISWSIGSLLVVGVAAFVLPYLGWRWFVFFASVPLMVGIISLLFVDESIRFLVVNGQKERAMEIIKKFSYMNDVAMPTAPIDMSHETSSKNVGNISLLFSKRYCVLTILQLFTWFAAGSMYYGAVILSTNMPAISYGCLQNSSLVFHSVLANDDGCCKPLNHAFYTGVAISSIGDLISIIVDAFILDILGRRLGLAVCAIISGIGFFVLDFCMQVLMRSIVFLGVRCFTLGFLNGWAIFTLELYPTTIRSTGFGVCQLFGRMGAAVTSFSSVVLLRYNTKLTLFLYAGISIVAVILTLSISTETSKAALEDDASSDERNRMLSSKESNYASVDLKSKDE